MTDTCYYGFEFRKHKKHNDKIREGTRRRKITNLTKKARWGEVCYAACGSRHGLGMMLMFKNCNKLKSHRLSYNLVVIYVVKYETNSICVDRSYRHTCKTIYIWKLYCLVIILFHPWGNILHVKNAILYSNIPSLLDTHVQWHSFSSS